MNPLKCERKELVSLLNAAGRANGWGAVITETTVGNLVSAGLPRSQEGRAQFYSVVDLAAYYAHRARTGDANTSEISKRLNDQKRFEEVRRLRRENDEKEGELIRADVIVAEWQMAGAIWNGRIQALVDQMRAARNEDAARAIESALAELTTTIESSIGKHTDNEVSLPVTEKKEEPAKKATRKKAVAKKVRKKK